MMDIYGLVLFNGTTYYRVGMWNGDFLIPWNQKTLPTVQEIQSAVNSYYQNNVLGVIRIK
jgi:hypothetical protein